MLLILDTCNVAVGREPSGGVTLAFRDIEGLPNIELMIPLGKESATAVMESMQEQLGPRVKTADLTDLKRETHGS